MASPWRGKGRVIGRRRGRQPVGWPVRPPVGFRFGPAPSADQQPLRMFTRAVFSPESMLRAQYCFTWTHMRAYVQR